MTRRSYTPRKQRPARARALPDAAGRGFRMRAYRLVVYFLKLFKLLYIY
jgi:hypothetical protein